MSKTRYFSIGKLSKLSGVHIQSLRYYQQLGILQPARIDPDTQYRYYTFAQLRIVEAIQYCVELDLPLSHFKDFIINDGRQINFSRLLQLGQETAHEKIRRINERLDFMQGMQDEIEYARRCLEQGQLDEQLPAKTVWCTPYQGRQAGSAFHSAVYRMISDMEKQGLRAGYNNGLMRNISLMAAVPPIFSSICSPGKNFRRTVRK